MSDIWNFIYQVISSYKFYAPVLTVCVALLISKTCQRLVKKFINKESKSIEVKRKNTIISLFENIISYVIIIIAFLIILSVWGVDVSGILTGLGIVGVVAGLAIQDALKDIIMGINIIMDNYFVVGDLVTYDNFTGEVIEFGLKNTKIMDPEGVVLVVSNRNISTIKNLSQKSATLLITIPTCYEDKSKKIEKVIDSIIKEANTWKDVKGECANLGVNSLSSSSVDYLLKVKCDSQDRYTVKRKILALVKDKFDENKVSIPYEQIEVHNG